MVCVLPYPKVDIKMTTFADLVGDMKVVALFEAFKEATLLLSRYDDVEGCYSLEGNHNGDREESELAKHCSAESC